MNRLKVILDTNIVVSGVLKPNSLPDLCLRLGLNKEVQLVFSEEVFAEYSAVLNRPRFNLSSQLIQKTLAELKLVSQVIEPKERLALASDPKDNQFLEVALAAKADFLITGNRRHFPAFCSFVEIVTPAEFINLFRP